MRFAEVDLNEDADGDDVKMHQDANSDEEEEEEGNDDEFIDILDILDGRGEVDNDEDTENTAQKPPKTPRQTEPTEEQDGDDQSSGDEEESDSEPASDVEDDDDIIPSDGEEDLSPEALDELQDFISTLDPAARKRKAPEDDHGTTSQTNVDRDRSRKQRRLTMLKELTEAGVENEFRAQTSGTITICFPLRLILKLSFPRSKTQPRRPPRTSFLNFKRPPIPQKIYKTPSPLKLTLKNTNPDCSTPAACPRAFGP